MSTPLTWHVFLRIAQAAQTTLELYEGTFAQYPDRMNPGALWSSAHAAKG